MEEGAGFPPPELPIFHPEPKERRKERILADSWPLPHPMRHHLALREFVRLHAEDRPGIYRMHGAGRELLYIGKSVRVRSRLLSYFRAPPGEKAARILRRTGSLEWEYVPDEFSALLAEMRLITRWRPPFNVEHRRRRSFAWVKISREAAARILPVSRVADDGASYFGPFPRPPSLGLVLRELSHLLGLRDCPGSVSVHFGGQLEILGGRRVPRCLRADTESCLAPCAGGCTAREYARKVKLARRFLEGRSREPLLRLQEEMEGAAARMDFEHAARVRDRLQLLESFQRQLTAFRGRVESLSFLYRVPGFRGSERLYLIREGVVEEELPYPRTGKGRARVLRRIEEVFGRPRREMGSLTPERAEETLLVARWFRLRESELRRTSSPESWLSAPAPSSG